jgi:hypothetical protein
MVKKVLFVENTHFLYFAIVFFFANFDAVFNLVGIILKVFLRRQMILARGDGAA